MSAANKAPSQKTRLPYAVPASGSREPLLNQQQRSRAAAPGTCSPKRATAGRSVVAAPHGFCAVSAPQSRRPSQSVAPLLPPPAARQRYMRCTTSAALLSRWRRRERCLTRLRRRRPLRRRRQRRRRTGTAAARTPHRARRSFSFDNLRCQAQHVPPAPRRQRSAAAALAAHYAAGGGAGGAQE